SNLSWLQVTWFKCGGISVGLSWAHILGDVLSASDFMNMWSQYMQGNHKDPKTLSLQYPQKSKHLPSSPAQEPISVKRVSPMGNNWVLPTSSKIHTHTFHLTPKQLDELHSKIHGSNNDINDNSTSQSFEVITAILWKSIAKVRNDLETKSVTICRPKTINRQQRIPYNGQVLGTIEANFLVSGANPLTLVNMIVGELVDENDMIEELVNKEIGKFDFIFYGTNITFVDMTEADVYDFKLKGNSPTFASYTVGGIQDKGAIFVFPGPNKGTDEDNRGKVIMLNLPKNEIHSVKTELKEGWCIA
ncbi:Protein ECERIFERUM 26-like, partial [Bienertia sinuspersici]